MRRARAAEEAVRSHKEEAGQNASALLVSLKLPAPPAGTREVRHMVNLPTPRDRRAAAARAAAAALEETRAAPPARPPALLYGRPAAPAPPPVPRVRVGGVATLVERPAARVGHLVEY